MNLGGDLAFGAWSLELGLHATTYRRDGWAMPMEVEDAAVSIDVLILSGTMDMSTAPVVVIN